MDDNPDIENELPERAYQMDVTLVDNVLSFIETQDKDGLVALFDQFHAADIADLFEQIDSTSRSALIQLWGKDIDGEVFAEMD